MSPGVGCDSTAQGNKGANIYVYGYRWQIDLHGVMPLFECRLEVTIRHIIHSFVWPVSLIAGGRGHRQQA